MIKKLSQAERRWLLIASLVILIAANAPALIGFLRHPVGTVYTGIDSTAPGDVNVYRSYLEQVYQGDLVFRDLFTSEPQAPRIVSPFWVVIGLLGKLTQMSTLAVYFISRILLGALLFWVIYRLAAEMYDDVGTRKVAWLLATVGAGVGAWFAPIIQATFQGPNLEQAWPMDIWVSEAFTFLSLHHSPHFLAATILILMSVALFARTIEARSTRAAVWAGVTMLGLYSFHPFHVLSLGMITLAFLVVAFMKTRQDAFKALWRLGLAWVIASPALVYQIWLILEDPLAAGRAEQNILPTTPILTTIISYGFLLVGAVIGSVWLYRKNRSLRNMLLIAWAVAHAIAIYLPVFFNRRVTQGLNIVLAFLAAMVVIEFARRWERRSNRILVRVLMPALGLLAFGMSTLWISAQDLSFIAGRDGRQPKYFFFLSKDYQQSFEWLRQHGDDTTIVLSAPITGNFIPGLSGRRVVVGHNVETLRFKERSAEVGRFFSDEMTDVERQAYIKQTGTSFVVIGPWENRIGPYTGSSILEPVFSRPTVTIYRLATST